MVRIGEQNSETPTDVLKLGYFLTRPGRCATAVRKGNYLIEKISEPRELSGGLQISFGNREANRSQRSFTKESCNWETRGAGCRTKHRLLLDVGSHLKDLQSWVRGRRSTSASSFAANGVIPIWHQFFHSKNATDREQRFWAAGVLKTWLAIRCPSSNTLLKSAFDRLTARDRKILQE
jgi:hypothetical protein